MVPYQRYALWYLISGHTDEELKKHLDDLSLPVPADVQVADLRSLANNLPLSPLVRKQLERKAPWSLNVSLFLHRLGYGEIYDVQFKRPDLDHHVKARWERVWLLIQDPTSRVAIECALMTGLGHEDVATMATNAFGTHLSPDVLGPFQNFFFSTQTMSKSAWREYLKACSDFPYVYVRYQTALLRPRDEVLHLVGMPTKTQLGTFLNSILTTANFKFQRYVAHNDPLSDEQARKWAKIGIEAGVRAEKFSASDITDFAKSIQSEFEYIDGTIEVVDGAMLADIKPAAITEGEGSPAPPPPSAEPRNPNDI